MFTIKSVNEEQGSTHLKSWASVSVYRKGHSWFECKKNELNEECESLELKSCNDMFKALLFDHENINEYWITDDESVYITDASGKTVEIIK